MKWECGEDFCEFCGDCMHCYGNDPCPNNWLGNYEHMPPDYDDEDKTEGDRN